MKKCSYCGAEYSDELAACPVDQTPFDDGRVEASQAPGKFADVLRWTPKSAFGLAFTSGLASLLICTGIYYGVNKVMFDASAIWKQHAADTVMPGKLGLYVSSPEGSPWHTITWHSYVSLFCLGALIFTFFVSYNRCQRKSHGVITAIITLGIIGLLTFMPMFVPSVVSILWLVPLVVVVIITKLSAGIYIGAALQMFVGIWLLGWFRKREPPNKRIGCTATFKK